MQKITRIILAASVLSGLMSSALASQSLPSTGAPKVTATVSVDPNARKKSVAPSFLGLSVVLSETPYMVGTSTSPNPHFRQLLGNLLAYSNGPMEIRELNDEAFGPTTISDHLPALSNLYKDTQSPRHGVKYFMGVDFSGNFDAQDNETGIAASQAESFHNLLPQGSVLSYEIGNEPDLYNAEHIRSKYTYAEYKRQYEQTRHGDATVSALRATNNDYRVSDYTHYTGDDKVTLAGQTFKVAGGIQDGVLHGTKESTTVHPKDGVYVVPLPHASAAIVELR